MSDSEEEEDESIDTCEQSEVNEQQKDVPVQLPHENNITTLQQKKLNRIIHQKP